MLSEILDRQPMESLLSGGEGVFCPEAGDPAWDTANPAFRQEIASLAAMLIKFVVKRLRLQLLQYCLFNIVFGDKVWHNGLLNLFLTCSQRNKF